MNYKLAIFDLDGTILNTLEDLADSTNYALSVNGMPERTIDEVRRFVGNGIHKLIERAVPQGSTEEQVEQVFVTFKEYYKGEDNMADKIIALKKNLRLKINNEVTGKFDSDDEYYFGVGQIVSYLLSKNKGKKKPHSLANPFINAKDNKVIKEKLRNFYKKYNYDIDMNGRRFKNLYAMILGYEADTKVNQDMIIAGYLNNNLIYESDKKEKEING